MLPGFCVCQSFVFRVQGLGFRVCGSCFEVPETPRGEGRNRELRSPFGIQSCDPGRSVPLPGLLELGEGGVRRGLGLPPALPL